LTSAGEEMVRGEGTSKAPLRRVRFPYRRVPIGVIGVLLSTWLWVGDSWRFDVTPKEIVEGSPGWGWKGGWVGRYVRLHGRATPSQAACVCAPMEVAVAGSDGTQMLVNISAGGFGAEKRTHFDGRAVRDDAGGRCTLAVDTTRGRWTGKSVIAVFVFLWGVGIIVSSVWLWKKRRRAAGNDAPQG
jgi:hypothetical protein